MHRLASTTNVTCILSSTDDPDAFSQCITMEHAGARLFVRQRCIRDA